MYQSCDGYFQQDNATCPKDQIISNWILEHDNEFTILKLTPHSPDLNSKEHPLDAVEQEIRILDVQPKNRQYLHDAIMSIWPKSQSNVSSTLLKSMPQRIKAVLKAKEGPTWYYQCVPNKVARNYI